jgi:hypothetical protein
MVLMRLAVTGQVRRDGGGSILSLPTESGTLRRHLDLLGGAVDASPRPIPAHPSRPGQQAAELT